MATAAFGRRNVAHHAPAKRAAVDALPRRADAEPLTSELQPQTESGAPAIDPGSARKIGIGALVLIGFAVLMAFLFFPDLRRDAALQDTFRPDPSVMVERASCSRYLLLVTHCSMHFSWQDGAAGRTAESSFLVGLKSMGGLRVIPVRSGVDPTVVTAAVALEHLPNRIWTLVLAPGACLLLGVLMLMKLARGRT